MSAATSPGSSSGTGPTGHPPKASPPPTTFPSVPLPPLPPLGSNVDPVALIDARIKVGSACLEKLDKGRHVGRNFERLILLHIFVNS